MGMNLHQGLLARLFWMVVLYFQVQTPFCLVLFISNRNAKCKERKQTLIIHIQMLKWHKCSLPLTLKQTLHHMTPKPVQGPQTGMIMRSLIIIMQSWKAYTCTTSKKRSNWNGKQVTLFSSNSLIQNRKFSSSLADCFTLIVVAMLHLMTFNAHLALFYFVHNTKVR